MFNSTMEYGYQPSIREVGEKFGISSPNGTYGHYRAMERYGYIGFRGKNHAGVVFLKTPAGEPFRGFTHKPE
jgi:repressor LexA